MYLKIKNRVILVFLLLAVCSCKYRYDEKKSFSYLPRIVEAKSYILPKDSIIQPKIIPVNEARLKRIPAGKPLIVRMNSNTHLAGAPKIIMASKPRIIVPGTDTFLFPQKFPTIGKTVIGVMPETIVAGDMTYKTPNPSSFSCFGKLQGLKHNIVACLLQDKMGNLWICTAGGATKYDGHFFTNFTEREGLVNNDVRSILQDRGGNIWFGTLGAGISKYDGHQFTNFTVEDGLCNNFVDCMVEDNVGNIWFGTWGGGVSKYDGHQFTNFTQTQGLISNFVQSIGKDRSGNIWIGTNGGASEYNGTSFTNFTQREGLSNNFVYSILEDKRGDLWFATFGGGVNKFNGTYFTQYSVNEGLVNNDVFSLGEDKDGNIWLGTHYGISKYDGRTFTNFTETQGLTNDNIYSILEDNAENMWFGTGGGGVIKYNAHSFTHYTEAEGLNKNYIFSVCEDKLGSLWFGTWRGGVSKYDGHTLKIFTEKQGLSDNDVRSICQDHLGNLWFATYKGVIKYDGRFFIYITEKDGLINNDVNSILEDKFGDLWIGTAGGASKYDGRSFKNYAQKQGLSDVVYCIKKDNAGNLIFGASGGIFKYDGHSFTRFIDRDGISNYDAICVLEDKLKNLWVGTEKGAFKYDGKHIIQFSEKEGLVNDNVVSILEDKSGNIWFGTRFGLSKFSPEKSAFFSERMKRNAINESDVFFKNFGYTDNFLGIGCNARAMLESRDNNIWIGTNGGLTTLNPSKGIKDTTSTVIQITAIKLANQKIDWTNLKAKKDTSFLLSNGTTLKDFNFDQLTRWYNLPEHLSLAYNNNYVGFDFIGISMNQPQKVKYQYQLEGLEKSMSALTTQTNVSYGNLIPGEYTFKVRAMNSEGYWSNESKYTFAIRPPWWQTWWFRILASGVLVLFIFFIARFIYLYNLRKQKITLEKQLAVEYERQRISADLHDDIGSTLSSINIYAGLAKKEANNLFYLDSISQNVNDVVNKLDELVWSINPKYDTINSLAERLKFYAEPATKVKEIDFTILVDDDVKDLRPSAEIKHHLYMVIKEIINNAIKHADCKHIRIRFFGKDSTLIIEVSDDGKGFDTSLIKKERNGLNNIKQRVLYMSGETAIISGWREGTRIIIQVPF